MGCLPLRFRRQHEQLYSVITKVLVPSESSTDGSTPTEGTPVIDEHFLQKEIVLAFENVKVIDCLDLTPEGVAAWDAALKRYDERIDVVETRIAAHLRDQLGTAKNANEMFRIFSRYNALFVRAHIQGAIREYQTQLIQRVKEDIDGLHQKFKGQYAKSSAFRTGSVRDIPPVSGSIIWAKQIDQQLTTYLQRVEAVLGKGWENHVEGQKLKADGDAFRQKLNTQQLFEEWKKKVESQPAVQGRIFTIGVRKTRSGDLRKLQVNFQSDVIQLSKEVRNLRWMGFRVPLLLVNKSNQANQLYPHAVSLMESVRTYELTCDKIMANEQIAPLVSSVKRDCQTAIQEGMQLEWSSFRLESYVRKFADVVFGFQERVDEAILHNEELEKEITQLSSCDYSKETYSEILERIQKIVDDLNLHSYSNLQKWVAELDTRVEEQLIKRLSDAITTWTASLTSYSHESTGSVVTDETGPKGVRPRLESVQLELRITNQVMYLNPPVEMARSKLIDQFHAWLSVITSLARIQSSRYQVGLGGPVKAADTTYSSLLGKLMQKDTQFLMNAFSAIDKVIEDVSVYVKVWLQYQSLWDMEQGTVYGHLGEDLAKWQQLLHEIKKSRATFDNTEIKKVFGPVMVHYGFVQKKVNDKYDTWHKEVLTKFGGMLGQNMQDFYGSVTKARTDLENHSVDAATTSEAVSFITLLQGLKRNLRTWEQSVEVFRSGQKILDRQRFQYPPNWLYADNVDSEWSAFTEILKRKDSAMQTQVATLQGKIMAEDKAMEQRAVDLLTEWEKGKPVQGNLRPDDALGKLQIFEGKFVRLKEERDNIVKAREALELEAGASSLTQDRLLAGAEELQDLKGVWTELSKIWQKIDDMKEKPWITVAPRKIRQELEALLEQMKLMPNNLKTYSSYDYVLKMIKGYTKVNITVTELKSEALKDRHWKDLMKKLRVRWVMTDLTLGQIWDVDLQRNEAIVKDVILMAQGEMGLEVFLRQVREYWNGYELEMVNYQNKCRLIKGWDDLFNKCKEHINQVAAMKLSPYYKVFEEEAVSWEDKLNRINALFDVWIDVQRRWVYLEGIFEGSTDIRHLLPTETQKFQSISTEFLSLMRRVAKSAQVMEVLAIPQVQKLLERLSDLLTKIQKALGEYLEKERAAFPRFYFVGDEDLMEIIGNSKNVARLQKHFKKMFAGVASVVLNEDNTEVLGVTSREGEEVHFKKPVTIVDRRINEWLKSVEEHIRATLAEKLAQSLESSKAFNVESPDRVKYLEWLDKYQVQVVDLTVQITWTANIELALTQAKGQDVAPLERVLRIVNGTMNVLADSVLQEQPVLRRKKLEHLITELVHQRGITRTLIKDRVTDVKRFEWLSQMRLYFDPKQSNVLKQLTVSMANANFFYGFEYLGVQEKLVQTPLTDRLYLTMTQALKERLGGSPFGPAGTGKTESVKALGNQLGRFVLVFNCDERFDFQAMGRIFVGLCQVGAWGCFDEFNRLEERMLSAVSQQIQAIQEALKEQAHQTSEGIMDKPITVDLLGRMVKVNTDTGIFITMNPGYAGRSNLPDNLKQLFRSLAMTKPDRQLIAEVMLYSQGFRTAEVMSSKAVPFFNLCNEQLSNQSHYDFGLRALKSVLVSAGNVKRNRILNIKEVKMEHGEVLDEAAIAEQLPEQEILIQSICETMVPKLVAEDIPLLYSLLSDVFPGIAHTRNEMTKLRNEVVKVCNDMHLVHGSGGDEIGNMWLEKVLQLYQIADLNHGLMMVGPSGSGKSTAWKVLLKALENLEGVEGVAHVIDPKVRAYICTCILHFERTDLACAAFD
jgi:dynein heavy chain 1